MAGTSVFTSVLTECSAWSGLGERHSPSCLIAVLIGHGTAVAGMKIHSSEWNERVHLSWKSKYVFLKVNFSLLVLE